MNEPSAGVIAHGLHRAVYRVYYEDTDAGGIVYYANYLKFAERARSDALRCLGVVQSQWWQERQVAFVVRHCAVDFRSPARLDDVIAVETSLQELTRTRMTMRQIVRMERGDAPLAEISVAIACVGEHMKPRRIPDDLADALRGALLISHTGHEIRF